MSRVVLTLNGHVLNEANLVALGLSWVDADHLNTRFMPMEFDNGLIEPILCAPNQPFEARPGEQFRYPARIDGQSRLTECWLIAKQIG